MDTLPWADMATCTCARTCTWYEVLYQSWMDSKSNTCGVFILYIVETPWPRGVLIVPTQHCSCTNYQCLVNYGLCSLSWVILQCNIMTLYVHVTCNMCMYVGMSIILALVITMLLVWLIAFVGGIYQKSQLSDLCLLVAFLWEIQSSTAAPTCMYMYTISMYIIHVHHACMHLHTCTCSNCHSYIKFSWRRLFLCIVYICVYLYMSMYYAYSFSL